MTTNHDKIKFNKIKYKPLYKSWTSQPNRRKSRHKNWRTTHSHTWCFIKILSKKVWYICRGPGTDPWRPWECCLSVCEINGIQRALFSWCPPSPWLLHLFCLFFQDKPWLVNEGKRQRDMSEWMKEGRNEWMFSYLHHFLGEIIDQEGHW